MFLFRPRLLFLLLLLLSASPAVTSGVGLNHSLTGDYVLKVWETDDGLPHNSVTSLVQHSDGFFWIATQGGLVRFDGLQFTEFSSPLIGGAKSESVVALLELDPDTLLVAAVQSGLLQLQGGELKVHPLTAQMDPKKRIIQLFHESDGVFWVIFNDREAWRWNKERAEKFAPPSGVRTFWPASFACDLDGTVYLSRGSGIERYEAGSLRAVPGSPANAVTIAASQTSGVWVATGRRLAKLHDDKLSTVAVPPPWTVNIPPAVLYEDRSGALWLAPPEQNLMRWKDGASIEIATSHVKINELAEDDEGNLWVATGGGGLDRVQRTRMVLIAEDADWTTNVPGSICEDPAGNIWFSNRKALRKISGGQVESLGAGAGWPKQALPVCADQAGNLWLGAGPHLYRAKPGGLEAPSLVEENSADAIHVLFCARDGSMWIGRNSGPLQRYFPDGTSQSFGDDLGYSGRGVRAIGEDAAGHVWVGTEEGLLFEMTGARFVERSKLMGAPEYAIRAIHGDTQGGLWVGTAGAGLLVKIENRLVKISEEQGLPDEVVSQILEDDFGWLWLGSRLGICKVSKKDLLECAAGRRPTITPVAFGRADGLSGISAVGSYQPTAWKTRSGQLWFVTRKGLVTTDPAQHGVDRAAPRIYLDQFLVDGRPVDGAHSTIFSTAKKLEFQFTAPTYRAPERVRFRYRLEGFDSEWIDNGTRRFANYPALPPGRYVFNVSASNGDLVWSVQPATLAFQVYPRWWERGWTRLFAAGALVASLVVLVRFWSQRRLKARLERLEQKQRVDLERVRIARDLHDDLGASLTQASLMAEELAEDWNDIPDPRTRSSTLAARVRTIARDLDAVVWTVSPKNDSLASLSAYLCHFAEEYFRATSVECHAQAGESIPAVPLSPEVRHHLFMIAKELFNNVLKHAGANKVSLTMQMAVGGFELIVTDDGRGFSVAEAESSGRNGLRNLRARAADAGCSLELLSTPQGTTVTLRFPVETHRAHLTISHGIEN